MHLTYRNVNDAFRGLVSGIDSGRISTDIKASRYGEVMAVDGPVIVSYRKPAERVLFNIGRDANVFFHLYEALWMLAGRNDVAPLAYYNSRMTEFSDDGRTLNGAYGYRWRRHKHHDIKGGDSDTDDTTNIVTDQLDMIVAHLAARPESRRAVLDMWNVEDDLLRVGTSKDVCCNLNAVFKVEMGDCPKCRGTGKLHFDDAYEPPELACYKCKGKPHDRPALLSLTVFNRSNDLVWGLAGANAVHFSVLLEYVAASLGLGVGEYHQVTADLHCYTETWRPNGWLNSPFGNLYHAGTRYADVAAHPGMCRDLGILPGRSLRLVPLVGNPAAFDRECAQLVSLNDGSGRAGYGGKPNNDVAWSEPFLQTVARPMLNAYHCYRMGKTNPACYALALRWAELVAADDWRVAARLWLEKRLRAAGFVPQPGAARGGGL